jgi:methyltransferase (TIGR00027 family)
VFPDIVSHTSLLTAAARAAESLRPDRLFDDPHAAALAGPAGDALLAEAGRETAVPSIAIRTRFYDGAIQAAVLRGVRQIVLLGAGLDTRAYRLGLPGAVRWFEVDRAPVLAYKRQLLAGAAATVTLHDVPGDACEQPTFDALRAAGLDPRASVLWVAEGLLCFLGPDEIGTLFERVIQSSTAPGSAVLFDVPNLACVNAQGAFARAGAALLKRGLRFGTDDPLAFAASFGLAATVVHEGHPLAHFGRRASPPFTDVVPGSWTVYFVQAEIHATSPAGVSPEPPPPA